MDARPCTHACDRPSAAQPKTATDPMAPSAPRPTDRCGPAALLAAVITVTVFCAADAVARSYPVRPAHPERQRPGQPVRAVPRPPVGPAARTGPTAACSLNWQSGYGTSFLPDLGTYLTSPFALLVGGVPAGRDRPRGVCDHRAEDGVRRGRHGLAAADAAARALVGGGPARRVLRPVRLDAWPTPSYNPMWLDGLIALPLLCLVGEWTLNGRRPVLGGAGRRGGLDRQLLHRVHGHPRRRSGAPACGC